MGEVTRLIELSIGVRRLQMARVRATCFAAVLDLDVAKREGRIWLDEEYQKELARIRDYGIMKGLTAKIINDTFRGAHEEAATGIYKSGCKL